MKQRGLTKFGMTNQVLWVILGVISIVMISFFGYQKGTSLSDILKLSILSIILISIIIFYILSQQLDVTKITLFNCIFIITYFLSLLFIIITKGNVEFPLWISCGLIIALLFNEHLGYIVTYNLLFFASFVGDLKVESVVYLLIIGTILCMLAKYLKEKSTALYAITIILSLQIILLFILNSFDIKRIVKIDLLMALLGSLMVIAISFVFSIIYHKLSFGFIKQFAITKELAVPYQESLENNQKPMEELIGTHTWEEIFDPNFSLLQRLKIYSSKLYNHSLLIGDISEKAAMSIGADTKKAKAGGLYHEIGRIEGTDYIEEGIKLAEVYHLPNIIKDIIRQHNLKYGNPKTPEAAIVMLTVSIITSKEYLEKTIPETLKSIDSEATLPLDKIIDNVLQMRLEKGSLDEAGISLLQYNKLREFYLQTIDETM